MATQTAVWVPMSNTSYSGGQVLSANTATGPIYLGKRQIFRIWSSATMNMNIAFGNASIGNPSTSQYAIGPVPQEFDTGDESEYINIMNNNSSIASYYYQIMSRF